MLSSKIRYSCVFVPMILSLFLGTIAEGNKAAVQNTMSIKEVNGVTQYNRPIQIGRPFMPGEIKQFPQVLINGGPVQTQANVKSRWPDGSVKHAILSFLIPVLNPQEQVTLTFREQAQSGEGQQLNIGQMLDPSFDFDARMLLVDANYKILRASARQMLKAEAFEYWMKGPVATSIILADHSENPAFDLGFGAVKPFRPIFHATFWPGINKVRVRYIGEVANTEALQDMHYASLLMLGDKNRKWVHLQSPITHFAASRWTKEFWLGGKPANVAIDHNVAYLAQTTFIPNYDPAKKVSKGAVGSAFNKWQNTPRGLFQPGKWTIAMGTAGGRSDIGPYPTWTVQWLYSGTFRMKRYAFGQADLAAAWPMHFREGKPGKNILRTDPYGAGTGVGKIMSVSNRPSICLWVGFDYAYTDPQDRIVPTGAYSTGGWNPDGAHQPDAHSPQYTLTGDYWYLEEMMFWASYSAARYNGKGFYGRGPTGAEGGIHDETRGDAWVFRNRVHAAFLAPDGSPEKTYFTTLAHDAIAIWEGVRDIRGGAFEGTANWTWGNNMLWEEFKGLGVPPLHHWDSGNSGLCQEPVDAETSEQAVSPWEENFMLFSLGRAKELGFPTGALLSWSSRHLIDMITDPDFDRYLVACYRLPTVRKSDTHYFDSYNNLMTGIIENYNAQAKFLSHLKDPEHGYSFIAMAAASMVTGEVGGQATWNWIAQQGLNAWVLNDNPKWAIKPRGQ